MDRKPKVFMYARFDTDIEQEEVELIKEKLDGFLEMIDAELMGQHWEILQKGGKSRVIHKLIEKCSSKQWGILTYDLKTLHEHHSGALSIISEGDDVGVPIFFIEAESVVQSIFTRL